MLRTYFNITVIAEWFTFIAALILLNKKTGVWRLFILLLFLVLCTETIGWYQSYIVRSSNNSLLFNFLMITSIGFFLWLMAQAKSMRKVRKYFYGLFIFFIFFAFVNLLFLQGFQQYNDITEVTGDILLAINSGYLILGLIKEEDDERSLFSNEFLWLAIGLLFSALGSSVLYTFLKELQAFRDKTHINVYGYINYVVNILLYACLIIAFICRRKTRSLQEL